MHTLIWSPANYLVEEPLCRRIGRWRSPILSLSASDVSVPLFAQAERMIAYLAAIQISVDDQTNRQAWSSTLSLARQYSLSSYDAAYLELALRRGLKLATLDGPLKAAALSAGVGLYGMD